jgi:pimeloyl-ACP methyl ester carboxylesterase
MTTTDSLGDTDLTHETVRSNRVDLHCVTAGPDDGDLVLLLHGFPEFWYSWKHQLPALVDAGYRVVAPDLRGYNRSGKPDGVAAYRVSELIADVAGLVDHYRRGDDERANVVGHDWGGLLAWYVAAERPDVVDRLVVLNAPHPNRFERQLRSSFSQLRKSWYVFYFQLPGLPEFGFRWNDYAVVESLLREETRPGAFTDEDVERYKSALATPGTVTAALNYYRALGRQRVRQYLVGDGVDERPIDAPTMLVWGDDDHALDVELTQSNEQWVESIRVERIAGASHWVQFDAKERVNELLVDFL